MHAGGLRATLWCWGALLFLGFLTGCASPSGRPPSPGTSPWTTRSRPSTPRDATGTVAARKRAQQRVLLATSDSPPATSTSTGQSVQGYNVPGRNPSSQAPWEFFLGNAAHRLIAYMYKVNYPERIVYFNNQTMLTILADIGDLSRLLPNERLLRPDITDISIRQAFEIKPWNDAALQEGRQELQAYLAALNRALLVGRPFTGGTGFQGQVLVRFAQGQHIWRLEWQTTEPGITQYRWTRSQQRFASERAAYEAGQWVDLTVEEMRQYGGWVGQAVEGMVTRREQLATARGAVGILITVIGETAKGVFMGAILGRLSPGSGAQQPPTQGGGQVIPFPPRPPASAPPAQVPAAAKGL